jgi:hypothetical protein
MNVIEKGIKVNQKYHDAEQYSKKLEGISRATNWFETKTKYDGAKRILEQDKLIQKELEFSRRELTVRRMTRLQALYEKEMEEWENELRARGLAIFKNKL